MLTQRPPRTDDHLDETSRSSTTDLPRRPLTERVDVRVAVAGGIMGISC